MHMTITNTYTNGCSENMTVEFFIISYASEALTNSKVEAKDCGSKSEKKGTETMTTAATATKTDEIFQKIALLIFSILPNNSAPAMRPEA